MHQYATTTTEARELVSELEFVWDQIKSNSASSSASSSGQAALSQGQQAATKYASSVVKGGSRLDVGGFDGPGRLTVLQPISDGDEGSEEEGDGFQNERVENFGNGDEAAVRGVAQGRDLDVRNRKWRKRVERALIKMTTEIAALREQLEAKKIVESRRRCELKAWMSWLVWLAIRHAVFDGFVIVVLFLWTRQRRNRRAAQGLKFLMGIVKEQLKRLRVLGKVPITNG